MLHRSAWSADLGCGGLPTSNRQRNNSLCLSRSQPAWPTGESGIGTGNSSPAVRGFPDRLLRRAVWGGLAPAPTQEGRPPPPKRKREESPETMARWRQDSQQFAPWRYWAYALVESHGKVGEFLHDFPVGYTAGCPERERCKQLGNSWHLPTSRFILFVLLFSAQVLQVSSSSQPQWYTQLPSPTFEVRYHPEGSRPLLRACSWWRRAQLTWDPNEYRQHFAWATTVRWEDAFPAKLNPCLQWAYDQQQTFGPKLAQWRQAVVEDITEFVQELAEGQEAWLATSPQHVREVYKQGSPGYVFQLLAFLTS